MCDVRETVIWHDSCFIGMHRSTYEGVTHLYLCSWHDSFICVMFVTCLMIWLMFHLNASQHIWRSHVRDTTHSYVWWSWHDWWYSRLIHMCDIRDMTDDIRDMTHVSFECTAAHIKESDSWHDSFICVMIVTWLMIFVTRSYVIWLICIRAWHFWFICVTWLIH